MRFVVRAKTNTRVSFPQGLRIDCFRQHYHVLRSGLFLTHHPKRRPRLRRGHFAGPRRPALRVCRYFHVYRRMAGRSVPPSWTRRHRQHGSGLDRLASSRLAPGSENPIPGFVPGRGGSQLQRTGVPGLPGYQHPRTMEACLRQCHLGRLWWNRRYCRKFGIQVSLAQIRVHGGQDMTNSVLDLKISQNTKPGFGRVSRSPS